MKYKALNNGVRSIFGDYDCFIIDLWGVIHNGLILHQSAVEVLKNLKINKKEFFLVSNAPRPGKSVEKFLRNIDMEDEYFKHIYTSGDAALNDLKLEKFGQKFFHIGPARDFDLFLEFKKNKVEEAENADYFLCTGLFDDHKNGLDYYKLFLKKYIKKKLICTNPDLIVHKGDKEEYCAGSIAKIFEEIGGKSIYYGKPYPEIYNHCIKNKKKVLAIGDNLNTDIKGANLMGYDSLFITNGIHKYQFRKEINSDLDSILKTLDLKINFYQKQLTW